MVHERKGSDWRTLTILASVFVLLALFITVFPCRAFGASLAASSWELKQDCSLKVTGSGKASGSLRVTKYVIRADLDTAADQLDARITATVKNNTSTSVSTLYFRNMAQSMLEQANESYGDFTGSLADVMAITTSTGKDLKFSTLKGDPSIVKVKLGKHKIKPGKTLRLTLQFLAEIPQCPGRFGYTLTTKGKLYALGWCWPYLSDYRNGHWTLTPFPGAGENRYCRATAYDVRITAPKTYKVATSGVDRIVKGKKRNTTICNTKGIRDFAAVACNFMKKDSAIVRGVRVNSWYLPGAYESLYRADVWPAARDAVALLSARVGALPFKEVDIVQSFSAEGEGTVGVENSGLIIFGTDRYYHQSATPPNPGYLTRTAFHEMCHQWFYAAVGNDEYNEPWLDEGIASYYDKWAMWTVSSGTTRYLAGIASKPISKYLAGQRNSFKKSVSAVENSSGETKVNRSVKSYKSYFGTVYGTSVWFLLQLEEAIGHSNFKALMKDYYSTYCLKEATTSGFLKIAKAHCPKKSQDRVNALIKKYF